MNKEKWNLLNSRFKEIMVQNKIASFTRLAQLVASDNYYFQLMIDQITIKETNFFRNKHMFTLFFTDIISQFANMNTIHFLSAGCSTGQEAYSIAIGLLEASNIVSSQIHIDAFDLSKRAIKQAQSGIYTTYQLARGMPSHLISRYFDKNNEQTYTAKDTLKNMIKFNTKNVLNFQSFGEYQIIFFRNIAIYFNEYTKTRVFQRLYRALAKDGFLVVGSTENILKHLPQMKAITIKNVLFYQK